MSHERWVNRALELPNPIPAPTPSPSSEKRFYGLLRASERLLQFWDTMTAIEQKEYLQRHVTQVKKGLTFIS